MANASNEMTEHAEQATATYKPSEHDGLKKDGTPDKRVSSEHGKSLLPSSFPKAATDKAFASTQVSVELTLLTLTRKEPREERSVKNKWPTSKEEGDRSRKRSGAN